MSQHASDHARDTCHALQEDKSGEPLLLGHLEPGIAFLAGLGVSVSRYEIHSPAQHSHGTQGEPVSPVFGLAVGDLNATHVFVGVPAMVSTFGSWVCFDLGFTR